MQDHSLENHCQELGNETLRRIGLSRSLRALVRASGGRRLIHGPHKIRLGLVDK